MKVAGGGFGQCYNAQAVVDAASMLVMVAQVTNAANDRDDGGAPRRVLGSGTGSLGTTRCAMMDTMTTNHVAYAFCRPSIKVLRLHVPDGHPFDPDKPEKVARAATEELQYHLMTISERYAGASGLSGIITAKRVPNGGWCWEIEIGMSVWWRRILMILFWFPVRRYRTRDELLIDVGSIARCLLGHFWQRTPDAAEAGTTAPS